MLLTQHHHNRNLYFFSTLSLHICNIFDFYSRFFFLFWSGQKSYEKYFRLEKGSNIPMINTKFNFCELKAKRNHQTNAKDMKILRYFFFLFFLFCCWCYVYIHLYKSVKTKMRGKLLVGCAIYVVSINRIEYAVCAWFIGERVQASNMKSICAVHTHTQTRKQFNEIVSCIINGLSFNTLHI